MKHAKRLKDAPSYLFDFGDSLFLFDSVRTMLSRCRKTMEGGSAGFWISSISRRRNGVSDW